MSNLSNLFFGIKPKKLAIKINPESLIHCLLCAKVTNRPCYLICCKIPFCIDCISSYRAVVKSSAEPLCPTCDVPNHTTPVPGIPPTNGCLRLGSQCSLEGEWGECEECSGGRRKTAVGRCIACMSRPALCDDCVRSHEARCHVMVNSVAKATARCRARQHSSKELDAFCDSCDVPCCRECSAENHRGHATSDAGTTATDRLRQLGRLEEDLKRTITHAERDVVRLTKAFETKKRELEDLARDVSAHVASLIDRLRRNETEVRNACEKIRRNAERVTEERVSYAKYVRKHAYRLVCLVGDFSHPSRRLAMLAHFDDLKRLSEKFCQRQSADRPLETLKPLSVRHRFKVQHLEKDVVQLIADEELVSLPTEISSSPPPGNVRSEISDTNRKRSDAYSEISETDSGISSALDSSEVLGKPVLLWSTYRERPDGGAVSPYGVCFTPDDARCVVAQHMDGSLLVIGDVEAKRQQKYDPIRLKNFSPRSVVHLLDGSPRVAVADNYDMRLKIVDYADGLRCPGRDVTVIEIDRMFTNPAGLAILAGSHDYVVSDVHRSTVSRVTPEGKLSWSAGGDGGERSVTADFLSVDGRNRIVVSDRAGNCVKVLDSDGNFLCRFGSDAGGLRTPAGVCVDRRDNIVVADSGNHRIVMFSRDGKYIQELLKIEWPYGIAMSTDSKRLCVSTKDGNICYFKINR